MAEKSLVNDVAEIDGAAAAVVVVAPAAEELDELDLDELLQATRPVAVTSAADMATARLAESLITCVSP
jgi:hypothetical protein